MSCGAIADRVQLAYGAELSFGVTPTPAASFQMQDVRFISESLAPEVSSSPSSEIRDDRQLTQTIKTNEVASGDTGFELSYGTYDEWLEAVLFATGWSAAVVDIAVDPGIGAVSATQTFEGIASDFANYSIGGWVLVAGFAQEANNGIFKIVDKAGDDSTITVACGATQLVDETAGADVDITQGSEIVNGVTERSFSFERVYTDLTDVYHSFTGMTANTFALSTSLESPITGTFGWSGKRMITGIATIGDGSNVEASTTEVMSAGNSVLGIFEDCDDSACVTEFSIEVNNGLRNKNCVTSIGPACMGADKFLVTGSMQNYFTDSALVQKLLDFTTTSLSQVVADASGNSYVFDLPRVRITADPTAASGGGSDIFNDASWAAERDPGEGITMRVVRFPTA